ncbi:hypothetical protein Pmar_PMAR014774, partial [Perkinsus marinus ATCC 50983]
SAPDGSEKNSIVDVTVNTNNDVRPSSSLEMRIVKSRLHLRGGELSHMAFDQEKTCRDSGV